MTEPSRTPTRPRFERWDAPEEIRAAVARFAAIHGLNELVGVLPYAEWLDHAPSLARKQALTAKIQDEVGHGHGAIRLAEDLGIDRDRLLSDFAEGRSSVHYQFHFDFASWEEFGVGTLLQNSAAIVQFSSLKDGAYLPYARLLRRIGREESFHYHHALDVVHEVLTHGDAAARARAHRAVATWLPRVLVYFGPPDTGSLGGNRMWQLGLKPDGNDALRERWLDQIVPTLAQLGLAPDVLPRRGDDGRWRVELMDWADVRAVVRDGGPAAARRREHVRRVLADNAPYRAAIRGTGGAQNDTAVLAEVFEVFLRGRAAGAARHAGSLVAAGRERALYLAKEAFGRREDLYGLHVTPRPAGRPVATGATAPAHFGPALLAKQNMPHRHPRAAVLRRRRRDPGAPLPSCAAPDPDPLEEPARVWRLLAEDLFLCGHRLAGRIVDYVEVEESLAVGSIAQEDVAHAHLAMRWSGLDDRQAEAYVFDRPPERWRPSALSTRVERSWSSVVARGLVLATATCALLDVLADAQPGAGLGVDVVRAEQALHREHWLRWDGVLAADTRLRREGDRELAAAARAAADLFGTGGPRAGSAIRSRPRSRVAAPGGSGPLGVLAHARLRADLMALRPGRGPDLPAVPVARQAHTADLDGITRALSRVRAGYVPGAFT